MYDEDSTSVLYCTVEIEVYDERGACVVHAPDGWQISPCRCSDASPVELLSYSIDTFESCCCGFPADFRRCVLEISSLSLPYHKVPDFYLFY